MLVGDDRAAALADRRLPADEARVALQALEAVALLAHLQALAHHGEEVDEHALAQEDVDLVLARGVLQREGAQLGRLVGGVVEDVQPGWLRRRAITRSTKCSSAAFSPAASCAQTQR